MAGLKVITPPAVEPVILNEVKTQLRYEVSDTSPDDILSPLIVAAREWCEGYQNRAYITQTLELALDEWPSGSKIEFSRPKLQSVISLTYTDINGTTLTWDAANYALDDYSFIGGITKKKDVSWPSVQLATVNGIKVRYMAGYGDAADDVPQKIKYAIILLAMYWFENGISDDVPAAVKSLLAQDRVIPV